MSRGFSHNQAPLSPTERSNSVNLTEISNMQSQNDEQQHHSYSRQDLSQTTQAFNEMKANYQDLIGKFANSPLSSGSGSSNSNNFVPNKSFQTYIGDISSNFLVDENAELEVQQWGIMWTHLVSMITQVIPYQQTNLNIPKSGNEKRAILVDLVSKLCENATNPKLVEDYNLIKKKYQKNKKSLKKLREQGEALMLEVKKNKELLNQHLDSIGQNDESKLSQKIKQLEELLKKQVQGQAELLSIDLQRQSNQSNSKRFISSKSRVQTQNLIADNHDDIIIEEEEEDINDVVDQEAENLIRVVKNQVKIENQNATKSISKNQNKKRRNHRNHQNKEIEYEYNYEYLINEYDSNPEPEQNNIRRSRNNWRRQNQEITKNEKAKIVFDQNRKRNYKQPRAQTQIQINDNDLFSSSSSLSAEDDEFINERSMTKTQSKQKSKKNQSHSKLNQINDEVDNNIQRNLKAQAKIKTKSSKSSYRTDTKFQQNDSNLKEFEDNYSNIELANNSQKKKRKNSPDLHMRKALGEDVNQLVVVANSLKRDYIRLRKVLGNELANDMSIEQLSRIHDSLISAENQFDNISE